MIWFGKFFFSSSLEIGCYDIFNKNVFIWQKKKKKSFLVHEFNRNSIDLNRFSVRNNIFNSFVINKQQRKQFDKQTPKRHDK